MVASTSFVVKMAAVGISSYFDTIDPPSSVAEESKLATTIMVVAPVVVLEQLDSKRPKVVEVYVLPPSF